MLVLKYEIFKIRDDKRTKPMFKIFSTIVNDLHALGNYSQFWTYHENLENASKIMAIKGTSCTKRKLSYYERRGKLLAYKGTYMKEEMGHKKKKTIAFKIASMFIQSEDKKKILSKIQKTKEKK